MTPSQSSQVYFQLNRGITSYYYHYHSLHFLYCERIHSQLVLRHIINTIIANSTCCIVKELNCYFFTSYHYHPYHYTRFLYCQKIKQLNRYFVLHHIFNIIIINSTCSIVKEPNCHFGSKSPCSIYSSIVRTMALSDEISNNTL